MSKQTETVVWYRELIDGQEAMVTRTGDQLVLRTQNLLAGKSWADDPGTVISERALRALGRMDELVRKAMEE